MNLIRYNNENTPSRVEPDKPYIRVNSSGGIVFSRFLTETLKIDENSRIEILQNKDAKSEWFIVLTKSEHGFKINLDKHNGAKLAKATIAKKLLNLIPEAITNASFRVNLNPVDHQGEKLYAIFTQSYKEFQKK